MDRRVKRFIRPACGLAVVGVLAATGPASGQAATATASWSTSELKNFSPYAYDPETTTFRTVQLGNRRVTVHVKTIWKAIPDSRSDPAHMFDTALAAHYDGWGVEQAAAFRRGRKGHGRGGFAVGACLDDPSGAIADGGETLNLRLESTTPGADPTPWVHAPGETPQYRLLRSGETREIRSCRNPGPYSFYVVELKPGSWVTTDTRRWGETTFPSGISFRLSAAGAVTPPRPATPPAATTTSAPPRPTPSLVVRSPEAEAAAAQRAAEADAARRAAATDKALADIARSREAEARRQAEIAARAAAAQADYERKKREHEAALARSRAAQEEYRRKCEAVRAQGGSCVIER